MGTVVRRGNLMEELTQRLQQRETQVGQQRAVIEHQQEQLMRQQTTLDAERAARTPVNPAQEARINLVDLRGWKQAGDVFGRDTRVERLVIQDATVHCGGG